MNIVDKGGNDVSAESEMDNTEDVGNKTDNFEL